MDNSDLDLRKYFWRAATICRRHGLKRSAVVIADNIEALTDAMIKRSHTRPVPPTTGVSAVPSSNP